ncbi:hypothetical protein F383_07750 [Gossypium arboreum]|uniref:Tetraspanin-20-like n=1 Tax=Gossypium arboreum TaxID=29729 RepID=A0A0B0MXS0_GOSAR|nr:hypothetical protein F383_07750 [Gossypium arboreum]
MRPNCCHVSFAFVLKFLNFLQAFLGVSILLYSLWMLDQWNHHVPISPPPSAPSPDSSLPVLFNSRPVVGGARAAKVFDDLAAGLVSGLDNGVGFELSSVKLPAPWFIYSFMGVGIVLCCISLIEASLVAFIAIDRRWEKDIPFDPTGELDSLRSFIEDNIDICKWVGLSVVIIQVLALLVAVILRAMVSVRRRDIDDEDDYERGRTREPLLHPQSNHTSTSAKDDGRVSHSDFWGSRIREKYGMNSGDRYNSADKYDLLNQNASSTKSK